MKGQEDKGSHKSRKFLKQPEYPGGNAAFREFIRQNLRYPEEALKNEIQGVVYLEYPVDNVGNIGDIVVKRPLGYGCDEEAIRLVKLIRYPAMRNRGVKMKTLMKTQIEFRLPPKPVEEQPATNSLQVNYTYTATPKAPQKEPNTPSKESYQYTIKL